MPRRLYSLPRTRTTTTTRRMTRLLTERSNLQNLKNSWDEEILSTHVGRAIGNLQQQQRRLEKLFSQMLKQALDVNSLRMDDLRQRDPAEFSNSLLPGLDRMLERGLRSALTPRSKTKTTVAETSRSQAELSRFRAAGSDAQKVLQGTNARALRNQ